MSETLPTAQISEILKENFFADYKKQIGLDLNQNQQRGYFEIINGWAGMIEDEDMTKSVLSKLAERRQDLSKFKEDDLYKALEFLIVKSWDGLEVEYQQGFRNSVPRERIEKLREKIQNY